MIDVTAKIIEGLNDAGLFFLGLLKCDCVSCVEKREERERLYLEYSRGQIKYPALADKLKLI